MRYSAISDRVAAVVSIEGNLIAEDCGLISRKLATANNLSACNKLKRELIKSARQSRYAGWHSLAEDIHKVQASTLAAYGKNLVELSDSGTLLTLYKQASYRKCYIYGNEYQGHAVLSHLQNVPKTYIAESGHFVMYDKPYECAQAIQALVDSKPLLRAENFFNDSRRRE